MNSFVIDSLINKKPIQQLPFIKKVDSGETVASAVEKKINNNKNVFLKRSFSFQTTLRRQQECINSNNVKILMNTYYDKPTLKRLGSGHVYHATEFGFISVKNKDEELYYIINKQDSSNENSVQASKVICKRESIISLKASGINWNLSKIEHVAGSAIDIEI